MGDRHNRLQGEAHRPSTLRHDRRKADVLLRARSVPISRALVGIPPVKGLAPGGDGPQLRNSLLLQFHPPGAPFFLF